MPATRAWVLERLGQTSDARRDLIRAIDLAPSAPLKQGLQRRLASL
jgi:predicted RNA polymerase sigma factor